MPGLTGHLFYYDGVVEMPGRAGHDGGWLRCPVKPGMTVVEMPDRVGHDVYRLGMTFIGRLRFIGWA